MSEIRDKVKRKLEAILTYDETNTIEKVMSILSIPELAIVDREAELPKLKSLTGEAPLAEKTAYLLGVTDTGEQVLKAGWVKEVKDNV